jgi:hypothetical protein
VTTPPDKRTAAKASIGTEKHRFQTFVAHDGHRVLGILAHFLGPVNHPGTRRGLTDVCNAALSLSE